MNAIILAAGRGSRLLPSNPDQRPKSLIEIGGRTLLARMLEALESCGIFWDVPQSNKWIFTLFGTFPVRTKSILHFL